ncbi:MAG: MFS transporter [Planctomycetes bacterium]|nr:MFS transporter [Planctomycetota bacterium]
MHSPRLVLAVLFFINFLNYTDRYILSAVLGPVAADLGLSPPQQGFLATAFTLGYMFSAPIVGNFADRWTRPRLVAVCCALWSLATLASGLAAGYKSLLLARVMIGVGEAGYLAIGPTLIADYFSKQARGKALAVFYTGVPIGSACGYVLGGLLPGLHAGTAALGWRGSFMVVALPGLLAAVAAWFVVDPPRGQMDLDFAGHGPLPRSGTVWEQLALFRNRTFLLVTVALTGIAFATVPLLHWLPQYFDEVKGVPLKKANVMIGATLILPGIIGTLLGGWLGDRLSKRIPGGYLIVAAAGLLGGVLFLRLAIAASAGWIYLPALFFGVLCFMACTPTLNATIANISAPNARAMAYATVIFCMHALGDTASPPLFGKIIERGDLYTAFLWMPVPLIVAAVACLVGVVTIRRDMERTEARVTQMIRRQTDPPRAAR